MAVYQKIPISVVLKHYKRLEIQEALVIAADKKEIAISYGGTGYGKRPDVLTYPKDVIEMVKQGGTSFHCSEELWKNPLQVVTGMRSEELSELRVGWDLILDIDCPELEYSKIAADLLIQAIRYHGVKTLSIKFSGNHGFHIGVPFEAFPDTVNGVPTKNLFPDGPRKIAAYLASMIQDALAQKLLEKDPVAIIAEKSRKSVAELVKNGKLDAFSVLSIDTVLIASRHLYRMPYSINEKSGLISVVITPEEVLSFDRKNAHPDMVVPKLRFLEREKAVQNEAKKLIVHAFDFKSQNSSFVEAPQRQERKQFEDVLSAVPETFFPPCIQKISAGMADGKKRGLLILVNFLSSCGWDFDSVEKYVTDWNKRNPEPLREVYINGQLRYAKAMKKKNLPPSCSNKAYMVDIGVCSPDGFCPRIKNPAHYAVNKQRMVARIAEEQKPKRKKKDELPEKLPPNVVETPGNKPVETKRPDSENKAPDEPS